MFPQITLTGSWGAFATEISTLQGGNQVLDIAGSLRQLIFEGGQLLHKKRAAEAAYDQALAQYRSSVLSAFQNVADSLHALEFDAHALGAAAVSEKLETSAEMS